MQSAVFIWRKIFHEMKVLLLFNLGNIVCFLVICACLYYFGGFLDGDRCVGFLVAMDYAITNFIKYAGLWTLNREEKLQRKNNA